ncbi:TD and POZ domain-containing protein 1 [Nephila pilipes]|uniref:TD and POZ domain-containing protein 1 n=1 Tax=Nephila pilipes TaxID=299642 RepID=A0A8X6NM61_NEPPI|nr:TD and POZ domain-containing protein 1 [Nephila pilipes]GFT20159.1 TD and POZ domain-containing protein 1 [Nephila pilipes]
MMSSDTENYFMFTWHIENFSFSWQNKNENMKSPSFIVETMDKSKWCLIIYPAGCQIAEDYVSIYLGRLGDSKGPSDIEIEFELYLSTDSGRLISMGVSNGIFQNGVLVGFGECLEKEELFHLKRASFLPQDTLTVTCKMWKSTEHLKQRGRCVARTRIGVERSSFVWAVERFSSFGSDEKNTYEIVATKENEIAVSLNLFEAAEELICLEFTAAKEIPVFRFRLFILCAAGDAELVSEKEYNFMDSRVIKLYFPFHLAKKEMFARKEFYLPNDVLTLRCECAFTTESAASEIESTLYGCNTPSIEDENLPENAKKLMLSNTLKENLKSWFRKPLFSDTEVKTQTNTFPAHKIILSARSPVFKAMFTKEMRETIDKCVHIDDFCDDTVQRMLFYMYTDELQDLEWDSACDLYAAADKYAILSLKEECSSFLKANLSPSNACEALVLADRHSDFGFKRILQKFILRKKKLIMNSKAWEQLLESHMKLAADTMTFKFKER